MKHGTQKEIQQLADATGIDVRILIEGLEDTTCMTPRRVEMKPPGFWGYVVEVYQSRDFRSGSLLLTTIDWSTGGQNRELSHIATTRRFCDALTLAQAIAEVWNKGVK